MARPQFTLRALLVLMLAVGCFFGGVRFERERRRRADEAALQAEPSETIPEMIFHSFTVSEWEKMNREQHAKDQSGSGAQE